MRINEIQDIKENWDNEKEHEKAFLLMDGFSIKNGKYFIGFPNNFNLIFINMMSKWKL